MLHVMTAGYTLVLIRPINGLIMSMQDQNDPIRLHHDRLLFLVHVPEEKERLLQVVGSC